MKHKKNQRFFSTQKITQNNFCGKLLTILLISLLFIVGCTQQQQATAKEVVPVKEVEEPTPVEPQVPTCSDSDNGRKYALDGYVTDNDQTYTDTCESETLVKEYFCDDNRVDSVTHNCALEDAVCQDGKCVVLEKEPINLANITCGDEITSGDEFYLHGEKYTYKGMTKEGSRHVFTFLRDVNKQEIGVTGVKKNPFDETRNLYYVAELTSNKEEYYFVNLNEDGSKIVFQCETCILARENEPQVLQLPDNKEHSVLVKEVSFITHQGNKYDQADLTIDGELLDNQKKYDVYTANNKDYFFIKDVVYSYRAAEVCLSPGSVIDGRVVPLLRAGE